MINKFNKSKKFFKRIKDVGTKLIDNYIADEELAKVEENHLHDSYKGIQKETIMVSSVSYFTNYVVEKGNLTNSYPADSPDAYIMDSYDDYYCSGGCDEYGKIDDDH